jgi:hypothetical protein
LGNIFFVSKNLVNCRHAISQSPKQKLTMENFEVGTKVQAVLNGNTLVGYIFGIIGTDDGTFYRFRSRTTEEEGTVSAESVTFIGTASNDKAQVGEAVELEYNGSYFPAFIREKFGKLYKVKYRDYNSFDYVGDEDIKTANDSGVSTQGSQAENFDFFAIDGTTLYKVNGNSGAYTQLTGGWSDVKGMAFRNNQLFIISGTTLYRVDPNSGGYTAMGGSWGEIKLMTSAGNFLFIVEGSTMYKVDIATGAYNALGGNWSSGVCAAG